MKINKEYSLNNPLPYIFLVFILASITYEMFSYNKLQAILVACSFFLFIYFYKNIVITLIMSIFFVVAIINNHFYYLFIPSSYVEIRVEEVNYYDIKGTISGRVLSLNIKDANVKKGDRLLAKGKFISEKDIEDGVIGKYYVEDYKILEPDFINKLYERRESIFKQIEKKLGSRKAALITSVAFGYSDKLDYEDKEEMKSLGITHAISVSGLHMVLVFGVIKGIFGTGTGILISLLYVLFTGAPASAIRAYIMIIIMSSAVIFRRNYNPISALSLAGIVLLMAKPYEIFSIGFVLSFLATLGIILFNKKINKKYFKLPKYIRDTMSMSLSTQILTLPVILLSFGEFSINFIFGNLILLPLLNGILILGNLALIFSTINPLLNYILYLSHYCIKFIDKIIDFCWRINMNTLYLNYTSAYFYLALLITYYFYRRGFKKFIFFPFMMIIYISILIYSPYPSIRYYRDGGLLLSYKGERVLIQTKAVINKKKLEKIAMVNEIYSDVNKIKIDDIYVSKENKNYKLVIDDKEYLLLVNYEKIGNDYDIIDFRNGDLQVIWVFNKRIIARK